MSRIPEVDGQKDKASECGLRALLNGDVLQPELALLKVEFSLEFRYPADDAQLGRFRVIRSVNRRDPHLAEVDFPVASLRERELHVARVSGWLDVAFAGPINLKVTGESLLIAEHFEQRLQHGKVSDARRERAVVRVRRVNPECSGGGDVIRSGELERELFNLRGAIRELHTHSERLRTEAAQLEAAAIQFDSADGGAIDQLHRALSRNAAFERVAIELDAERRQLRHLDRKLRIHRCLRRRFRIDRNFISPARAEVILTPIDLETRYRHHPLVHRSAQRRGIGREGFETNAREVGADLRGDAGESFLAQPLRRGKLGAPGLHADCARGQLLQVHAYVCRGDAVAQSDRGIR